MKDWKSAKNSDVVCYCKNINKKIIVDAILMGNNSLQSIKEKTTACTGEDCKDLNPSRKCCSSEINELISIYSTNNVKETICSC